MCKFVYMQPLSYYSTSPPMFEVLFNPVTLCVFRLICTDAIARGMDVDNVKYVISYDATPNVNTYVHRVGRTARAGKTGTALTLVTQQEVSLYRHFVFHVIS